MLFILGVFLIANNVQATTVPKLDVFKETDHLKIYCTKQDASCLDDVAKKIEAKYVKISSDLACSLKTKIQIDIYPDLKTYHFAMGFPEAPDWIVGNAERSGKIKMVSPLNPGNTHNYQSMLNVAVHEVTHAFIFKINPKVPIWLKEGLASFEADQMDTGRKKYIMSKVNKNEIPKFDDFSSDSQVFGPAGGYEWSYTIVEFAVNTFGTQKLHAWIKNNGDFSSVFEISKEEFWTKWVDYLKTTYNVNSNATEIKEIRVIEAYWSNDERLKGSVAKKPNSIFLEVDLSIDTIDSEQISNFINKAGYEFELIADGKAKITASVYEGSIYQISNRTVFGFWIFIKEDEFCKLEHGIVYKLVPKNRNEDYKWIMNKDMIIELL